MAAPTQNVIIYKDGQGREPFTRWHSKLADSRAQKNILVRVNRLRAGNFGDCKPIEGGILELRIDIGPGYRVYCARDGQNLVILLCGGDKSSQRADIETAKRYWRQYQGAK